MKERKSDNLHALIHALSPTEKRFFKRFVKGRKTEQNGYLRLFDAINSMPSYSKSVLLGKVSAFHFHHHLEEKKHHLFELILDSQRQFRDAKLGLHNGPVEIDILIEKGLYQAAYKRIRLQKKQALQRDDFLQEFRLLQKELLLTRYMDLPDPKQILKDQKNCLLKSQNLLEYRELLNELQEIVNQNSFVRNSKQLRRFEKFSKNKLINNPAEAKSVSAQLCFYHFNYLFHASIGENAASYAFASKMHRLASGHPEAAGSFAQFYLRSVSARFSALLLKGYNQNEFNTLTAELKSKISRISDPELKRIAQAVVYEFQLIAYLKEHKHAKAMNLLKDVIYFLRRNDVLADGNAIKYLSFDVAKTFFITGNYAEASSWFLKTNYTESKMKGVDIYAFSRILALFCDIYLNQTEHVKYNAAYLRKQLSNAGALFEFESFLLSSISNHFINWNTMSREEKKQLLKDFQLKLKNQLNSKWKANTVLYFDFEWWTDTQIETLSS
jgi:hypothetical protein